MKSHGKVREFQDPVAVATMSVSSLDSHFDGYISLWISNLINLGKYLVHVCN